MDRPPELNTPQMNLFHLNVLSSCREGKSEMQLSLGCKVGKWQATGNAAYVEQGDDARGRGGFR